MILDKKPVKDRNCLDEITSQSQSQKVSPAESFSEFRDTAEKQHHQ